MNKTFKRFTAAVLSFAVLVSALIFTGAADETVTPDSSHASGYLSETYVFDFDKVKSYAVNSDYSVDEEGNIFYPLHSEKNNATVTQKNFTVDGKTVTTAEVSTNAKTVFIPTDENGQPFIVEPDTEYSVKVTYYNMAAHAYGQFYLGGGTLASNEQACNTTALNKSYLMYQNGSDVYTTGWNPFYRTTSVNWDDVVRYNPNVSFTTEERNFTTEDFVTKNGMFSESAYTRSGEAGSYKYTEDGSYNFGKYFGIFFSASTVSYNGDNGTYSGPNVYYIDRIEITANRSRTLEVGESYTFNFNSDEIGDFTVNKTSSTDGDGNTFYPARSNKDGTTYSAATVTYNGQEYQTLKISSADENNMYVPTDKNGVPFVIEPNTTYTYTVHGFREISTKYGQLFFGGGLYGANKSAYANGGTVTFAQSTYNDSSANLQAKYPIYRSKSFLYAGVDDTDPALTDKTETSSFKTGDFDAADNNTFTLTGSDAAEHTFSAYFGILCSGAQINKQNAVFYIDYITITKTSTTQTADEVEVTFDANDGAFESGETLTASQSVGSAPSAEIPTNTDSSLAFVGWARTADSDVVTEITSKMAGKTLYAVWGTPVENVTFNANGGTLSNGSTSAPTTQYVDIKLSQPNPTRAGYTFKGWGTSADATVPVTLATLALANTTLYAIWEDNPVPVTFNANGGKFSDSSTVVTKDQVLGTAPAVEEPTYDGHKFFGWATSADSTDTVDAITSKMENTTLYAVWKACHPEDGNYDSWSRTVEFVEGTYKVVGGQNTFVPTDASYGEYAGVPYFEVIDDPDEEGDSILHYYNHSAASNWAANWSITPTPTGVTNTGSDAQSGQVLPTNSTFKMTMRLRITDTGGGSPSISMFYGTTKGAGCYTDNTNKSSTVNLKTGLTQSDEWQIVETYFTTPDEYPVMSNNGNVANRLYVGVLCAGYKMKYDLDYIKLEKVTNTNLYINTGSGYVLHDTLEGVPGTQLSLPEYYSEETYSLYDPTGSETKMLFGNWYANEEGTQSAVMKYGNYDVNLYCDKVTNLPAVSTENQEMYVGFDTYTQRTEGLRGAVITDETRYSGSYALKATDGAAFELKNDHTLDVLEGKTYRVDFMYKSDAPATFGIGLAEGLVANGVTEKNTVALEAAENWTAASVVFTADGAAENSILCATVNSEGTLYIDSMIVSSATESVGVEASTTDNGEALRFMLSYDGADNVIKMAGTDYTVTEHGVIVKGQDIDAALTLDNANEAGVYHFAQTDMSKNWSVNPITGTTVYSAYLEGFEADDDYKVSVRGYVKLTDGTVYYTDTLTASVTDIPAAADIIPETANLTDYYVYLPAGTTLPADADYTVSTYDSTFTKTSAVSGNTITEDSYVLFSARPDFAEINVPSEVKYLVHAGAKADLYYGIESQIVTEKINSVGADTVNYLFITDIHFGSNLTSAQNVSLLNQATLMTRMANKNDNIDFVVIGGDTTTGMYGSKEACVKWTQAALDPFLECEKPVFVLMGNHDDNSYHLQSSSNTNKELYEERIITDLDWQNYIIDRYTNKGNITVVQDDPEKRANSKYFYYDLEGKKTRVIALDALDYEARYDEKGYVIGDLDGDGLLDGMPIKDATKDTDSAKYYQGCNYWGYSADQIRWLAEDALGNLPEDFDVIFVSHMGIDMNTNSYGTKIWFGENIREIIKTFNVGGSYTAELTDNWGTEVSVNADFSSKTGDILSWQFGHQHIEVTIYESDVDLWQICTPSSNVGQSGTQTYEKLASGNVNNKSLPWRVYTRKLGDKTEGSFNAMSVSSERIYRFTVGQGNNEKLVYSK